MDDRDQVKVHQNPYSKEGLGQQVMDMSVAMAKLSTDMDWVKETLVEIKSRLEHNDEEVGRMMKEFREYVDKRLDEHEERLNDLEAFRAKMKGIAVAVSAFVGSGLIVYLVQKMFGG